jgi:chemotaxis family two-component system sensor kinase Cph1
MNVSKRWVTILIDAIERVGLHDHLCLIYETKEEQFAAIAPFIRFGLERGERCVYIADENTAIMVSDLLRTQGIDVNSAVSSGALTIAGKQEAYLKQGYFDPDWMIRFLLKASDEAKAAGFSGLRVTGEMTWALGGDPGVERLMEYEAKLNRLLSDNDIVAICQYNRNRFSPGVIRDVLYTHPLVIYGGIICQNDYYIPPEEFLKPDQAYLEVERLLNTMIEREAYERALQARMDELERANQQLEKVLGELGRA